MDLLNLYGTAVPSPTVFRVIFPRFFFFVLSAQYLNKLISFLFSQFWFLTPFHKTCGAADSVGGRMLVNRSRMCVCLWADQLDQLLIRFPHLFYYKIWYVCLHKKKLRTYVHMYACSGCVFAYATFELTTYGKCV